MTQPFDFQLDGENVPVESARLISAMDTATDAFSVDVVISQEDQPELYEKIKPYRYTPVTVSLEDELRLTGNLTQPTRSKTKSDLITTLNGYSKTFNFVDSQLLQSRQFFGIQSLHAIALQLAEQTATQVVIEAERGGSFYNRTARRGQSAFEFLAPMTQARSQVMSCTPEGALLFTTANISDPPVGLIEESNPDSLLQKEYSVTFDGRKRFRNYKIVNQSPFGSSSGLAVDENITQPRNVIINTSDVNGQADEIANFQRNRAVMRAMSMPIGIVGWNAPDGSVLIPNTLITIKSETMFIPDGFTFLIRQVEYIYKKNDKSAIITVIPPNVYTKLPVIEPWFS